eukprot:403367705
MEDISTATIHVQQGYPTYSHYNPHNDAPLNFFQKYFEGTIRYEYDERIDEYNWPLIIFVQFIAYFIMQYLARRFAPSPGTLESFKAKKREGDYHTYYFQYTSFVHAFIGVVANPIILYMGSYRFNQPSHLYHKMLIAHAFAYFLFDTIIELSYNASDILINAHHIVVLWCSYSHQTNTFGGYEYCMLHLLAEVSNPFLQIRTALRICGKTETWYYKLNEKLFAGVFIIARLILSPIIMIYIYEGNNVLFITKFGMCLVVFIQYLWGLKILYNIGLMIKGAFKTEGDNEKGNIPGWARAFHDLFYAIEKDKSTKQKVFIFNLFLFVIIPNGYYGLVRGNLFRNF